MTDEETTDDLIARFEQLRSWYGLKLAIGTMCQEHAKLIKANNKLQNDYDELRYRMDELEQ